MYFAIRKKKIHSNILDSLAIRPLEDVLMHEQTLPHLENRIRHSILKPQKLTDPLIVDAKSRVILDGNHRYQVLRSLGYEAAVCQMVNYSSPAISLRTWLPAVRLPLSSIRKTTFTEQVDFEYGLSQLNSGKAFLMATERTMQNGYLLPSDLSDLQELLAKQEAFLSDLSRFGLLYIPEELAEDYLRSGYSVFFRRRPKKQEVLEFALRRELLPPKTTRHMIPNRTVNICAPLELLRKPIERATDDLHAFIAYQLRSGEMRYYPEPTIVFY